MHHLYDDKVIVPALRQQLELFAGSDYSASKSGVYYSAPEIDISNYDKAIVAISGGKDSIACLLHLIDLGFDLANIELWHHDVDGREGSSLMDWPFMADYNRKIADAFGLPLYFSWLKGGFEGEMTKRDAHSQPHMVETPDGLLELARDTTRSQPSTRMKFPQMAADLRVRWCSSALKIDVARRALNNQDRFDDARILFITGERREESANRARYNQLEPHFCDRRNGRKARHIDSWRPVLDWSEEQVWDTLRRHRVIAPVPYRLGWNRSSCMKCIFNSPEIWATLREHFPGSLDAIAAYEQQFGTTINRNRINIIDVSRKASPLRISDVVALEQALRHDYTLPVMDTANDWQLPAGAYRRHGCGPN